MDDVSTLESRLDALDKTKRDLLAHSTDLLYNVAITVADQISGLLVDAVTEGSRRVIEASQASQSGA